jgi:hypothetical protein
MSVDDSVRGRVGDIEAGPESRAARDKNTRTKQLTVNP